MWINRHIRASVFRVGKHFQHTQVQVQVPPHLPVGPVFRSAQLYPNRVALRDGLSTYSYSNLFMSANELSKDITKLCNGRTNERVMFLCPNDANYVIALWAIWLSGQIGKYLSFCFYIMGAFHLTNSGNTRFTSLSKWETPALTCSIKKHFCSVK